MRSLISIIIPVYNGETYIKRCFNMLKKQSFENFEAIFVNDGSTDGTERLIREYAKLDNRIKLYSKKNEGVSSARNMGLKHAVGDYVLFVDVDDYIFPNHVGSLYRNIRKYHADVSVGNYYKILRTEDVPGFRKIEKITLYSGREAAEAMLYRRKLNGYPVIKLIRAELARKYSFMENVAYGEDAIYVYSIFLSSCRVVYSSLITYLYYQNPDSANHSVQYDKIKSSWEASKRVFLNSDISKDNRLRDAGRARLYILAADFACRLKNQGAYYDVRQELIRFLRNNSKSVLWDNQCKISNRALAAMGTISPHLLLKSCEFYNKAKAITGFEKRKSL